MLISYMDTPLIDRLYRDWVIIGPMSKRHKLVHNGGLPKFEVLYCSQNTVKSIEIQ